MKRKIQPGLNGTLLTALLGGWFVLTACGDISTPASFGAVPANTPVTTAMLPPRTTAAASKPGKTPETYLTATPPQVAASDKPAQVYGSDECKKIAAAEKPWPKLTGPSLADYADVLYIGGIEYEGDYSNSSVPFETGPEFTRIKYEMSGYEVSPNWLCLDSVAAFIDLDTPVYTVKGYSPQFRLAAQAATGRHLYEVSRNPLAKTGSDLWDIAGKVQYIGINSKDDGKTQIAAIKDTAQVERLVNMLLQAPANSTLNYNSALHYFVALHLKDGTQLQLAYNEVGQIFTGMVRPLKEFGETLDAAVKAVPPATIMALTPTPKVQPGKPVNLAQEYRLDRAISVLVKMSGPTNQEITDPIRIKQLVATLDKAVPALDNTAYSLVPDGNVGAIIFKFGETEWTSFQYNPKAGILQLYANEVYNRVTITAPPEFNNFLGF